MLLVTPLASRPKASINGTVARYSYNAQGLHTGKTVGEQNTSFLLDGDNIVDETRGGSLINRYVYGVNLKGGLRMWLFKLFVQIAMRF